MLPLVIQEKEDDVFLEKDISVDSRASQEEEDLSGGGGTVWIILFGLIMGISLLSNLLFLTSLLFRQNPLLRRLYSLNVLLFLLNLLSDGLILFEFIVLGSEMTFPLTQSPLPCLIYQNALRLTPVVTGGLLVLCAYHHFLSDYVYDLGLKTLLPLGVLCLSLPTTLFTSLRPRWDLEWSICDIEVGSPLATSIYHLLLSAVLTYWGPLLLSIYPIVRLTKRMEKSPEISVTLSTISSYFVLYFPYAVILTTRYILIILETPLSRHQIWVINVSQSLSWLIAYFWHFIRPSLILVLDLDLKGWLCGLARPYGPLRTSENSLPPQPKKIHTVQDNSFLVI